MTGLKTASEPFICMECGQELENAGVHHCYGDCVYFQYHGEGK